MKKAILLLAFLFSLASYSSVNAQGLRHRKCGTAMLLERDAANGGKLTRAISQTQNYVPHTGTVTIPVILVNFNDIKFTVKNPRAAFEQFFNGTTQTDMGNGNNYNHGSVSQYFSDMSSGSFNIRFQVYGPVTLDRNETYYGGSSEDNNSDENSRALVRDAIAKLQASSEAVTDASAFCSDGQNVDCIYIVYAGLGQNDGGAGSTVWAVTANLENMSLAGRNIRWTSMAGELSPLYVDESGNMNSNQGTPMINGIGVTCHELSHALGLPDIYPYNDNATIDNQEMEYWDLMDGGEYSGEGYCPTAYTAFEKNEMGWQVDIRELNADQTVTMQTSTEKGGTAYKIVNPQNSNEYMMLECIQRRGWNRSQFGNGLLVYHVNRPSGDMTMGTRFNDYPNYPRMAVVPADGICTSSYNENYKAGGLYVESLRGDLFPGSGNMTVDTLNVTELSDAHPKPNFCWYNSTFTQKLATGKALQNIVYDRNTGYVSFNYINDTTTGISSSTIHKPSSKDIYTIDGVYVGNDINALPKGIYIRDGRKFTK